MNFRIIHTRLDVELDFDEAAIFGTVIHEVEPISLTINYVELDQAELTFRSIKVNGKKASFVVRSRSIQIDLGFTLLPGARASIEIEYSAKPRRGLFFRASSPDQPKWCRHAFTQGQSEDTKFWFPCYDFPNMRTTTEMVVTCPSNMVAISNGRLVEVRDSDSNSTIAKKTWHFLQEISHVSYLTSLAVGEFSKIEDSWQGVKLEYYFPPGKEPEILRSFGKTPKQMEVFSNITGIKYPYPKYAIVVVSGFTYGGMENITATTLDDKTLHNEREHLDFRSDDQAAHELAHQWYGNLITCKYWPHSWLNEAFATYCNALFREADEGYDDFQYYLRSELLRGILEEQEERYERPIVANRYWDADEMFDHHSYEKGALILHCLRGLVGDDLFFSGIKYYVSKHKEGIVETYDFRRAMEESTGKDLESFFDQWVFRPGLPEYQANYTWKQDDSLCILDIEQTNAYVNDVPLFTTPIEVRFVFNEDHSEVRKLTLTQKKCRFFFGFGAAPASVSIDQKNWIPKKLHFSKPKEMYIFEAFKSSDSVERIRACEELASFKTDDVVEVLSQVIDCDKFWGVKLETAKVLGKIGSKLALRHLLSRCDNSDHRVRRGIAYGLRHFSDLEQSDVTLAIESLIKILENDVSFYTRGTAANSLGFYRNSERAFEAMKSALAQDSINDVVRRGVFQGFVERRDARAVQLAADYIQDSKKNFFGKIEAVRLLGKLGTGSNVASDALFAASKSGHVRVMYPAALAFGDLNDFEMIPRLESWLSTEEEGRVKRALRETIYSLESRRDSIAREPLSSIRGQLNQLSHETRQLSDRLDVEEEKNSRQSSSEEEKNCSGARI
ncbi:MAG: M1 family aminopeptidase [Nitrososphaerales archaeon]